MTLIKLHVEMKAEGKRDVNIENYINSDIKKMNYTFF